MAAGAANAFASLYESFAPMLHAIGHKVLAHHPAEPVEDLVHEVMLEAWRRAESYDPKRGPVRSWLGTRMWCRAVDRVRAMKRAPRLGLEDARLADHHSNGDGDRADHIAVRKALASLSEEHRMVLALSYYRGLTAKEIAAELRIPVGTAKSRSAAGLRKLRAALSSSGPKPSPVVAAV